MYLCASATGHQEHLAKGKYFLGEKKKGQSCYWDLGSTLESRTALSFYLYMEVIKTFLGTKEGSSSLEVFLLLYQQT